MLMQVQKACQNNKNVCTDTQILGQSCGNLIYEEPYSPALINSECTGLVYAELYIVCISIESMWILSQPAMIMWLPSNLLWMSVFPFFFSTLARSRISRQPRISDLSGQDSITNWHPAAILLFTYGSIFSTFFSTHSNTSMRMMTRFW